MFSVLIYSFHVFNKRMLSTNFLLGDILSSGDIAGKRTGKVMPS